MGLLSAILSSTDTCIINASTIFVAILCYGKKKIRVGIWMLGPIIGGLLGIIGTYFGNVLVWIGLPLNVLPYITLIGMGISLITSLVSIDMKS